jgi:hypothetical protein
MDLWSPPHDAPHLLEWWRPLILVSKRARRERFPWPVHLDEFRLAGRVNRQGRPDIWIYDHHENGGSVCVDAIGQTYKFIATPNGKGLGQFRPCPVRTALWRARLPDVVAPIWFEEPPRHPRWGEWHSVEAGDGTGAGDLAGAGDGGPAGPRDPADPAHPDDPGRTRVVRRGHLTLIAG